MSPDDEALREAARHRGLKLVKSRRRKPGGDFGRYGLTDAKGAVLMGIGDDGLTATADEVAGYLRAAGATTWAESASIRPNRPRVERVAEPSPKPARIKPKRAPPPPSPPTPTPPPRLIVRNAGPDDAAAIVALVRLVDPQMDEAAIARHLAALLDAPEPLLVAERGGVVGVLAWHAVPLLQQAAIARITLLLVAEGERRQGTARALIDAALPAIVEHGCERIELVTPIEIGGIGGFLRRVRFEQSHYGYVRDVEP